MEAIHTYRYFTDIVENIYIAETSLNEISLKTYLQPEIGAKRLRNTELEE